ASAKGCKEQDGWRRVQIRILCSPHWPAHGQVVLHRRQVALVIAISKTGAKVEGEKNMMWNSFKPRRNKRIPCRHARMTRIKDGHRVRAAGGKGGRCSRNGF